MSNYSHANLQEKEFDPSQTKVVTPMEPVDDIRFLRNHVVPERDFIQTVPDRKLKTTPRFTGAACHDRHDL